MFMEDNINKEKVFNEYMKWVDQVSEEFDWKTQFSPKEIVYKICEIIENENNN